MIKTLNDVVWAIATPLMIICGVYFTKKFKFIQLKFIKMVKALKEPINSGITPFQSLMLAVAARIGVGSLAGVALSIYIGGIGSIFWMWLSSVLVAPNAFVESTLGVLYRKKDNNYYKGGPAFYIKEGLKKNKLAVIYALITIFCYGICFLSIQTNTITKSISIGYNINPIIIGIIITIISGLIIFKGLSAITNTTSKLVPIMGIGYLLIGIYICLNNIDLIPSIINNIFKSALNFKSATSGIFSSLIIGIQRGIFSNEAGLGTGAIASATSPTNKPTNQGLVQLIGIYFTSFIVCTTTALIILTSPYNKIKFNNFNGIELTQYALTYHLGSLGKTVIVLAILLFAFSTIVTGYYYAESNLKFIFPRIKNQGINIYRLLSLIVLFLGSVISATTLWDLTDTFVAIMAIINIYAIYRLSDKVKKEIRKDRNE